MKHKAVVGLLLFIIPFSILAAEKPVGISQDDSNVWDALIVLITQLTKQIDLLTLENQALRTACTGTISVPQTPQFGSQPVQPTQPQIPMETPQKVTLTKSVSTNPIEGTQCPIFTFSSDKKFNIDRISFTKQPVDAVDGATFLDTSRWIDTHGVTNYRMRVCFLSNGSHGDFVDADVVRGNTLVKDQSGKQINLD